MPYGGDYIREMTNYAVPSARRMVPAVLEHLQPASVVDVGCGLGQWAAEFAALGARVLGVDGPWVDRRELLIERFREHDLNRPLDLGERFDLAVCLEVAEHLEPEAGERLLDALAAAADVVLFSAAIPGQRGVGHVNEQWPAHWQRRFADRGYLAYDPLRDRFWDDSDVAWWYAQNTIIYARPGELSLPSVEGELRALVHPIHYGYVLASVPGPSPPLPRRLVAAIRRRL